MDKEPKMIEHHTKYKEIHGYDKTVWMTRSEHKKLHFRLRKEGKCNVSPDRLKKIAKLAHDRTDKSKKRDREFRKTKNGVTYYKNYRKQYQYLYFSETPGLNTQFKEQIVYNHATGTVTYSSAFYSTNNHKLPIIIGGQIYGYC